ncbi:MAG TPA: hypothetical protein VFP62_12985 [Burkholderiales bacterium]|jgi:hypothetical protein|nr:hypothetical protein [Burkholderiales bacterium]
MIRHLAIVLAVAVLAGCAATGSKLEPGATRAEVEKTMGKLSESVVRANGDTLLYFSRQPDGRAIYVATIGPDGKLRGEVQQTLTRRNIAGIKAGMQAKEVRELLGPPGKASRQTVSIAFEPAQRDIWEYLWTDVSEMRKLYLQFSSDGILREKNDSLDYENDKSKSMP